MSLPRVRACRAGARSLAIGILLAAIGCDAPIDPLPQPFPPNIQIAASPAAGSIVETHAADSLVLAFDRAMDPNSLRLVRRMSFLLPVSITDLAGSWNQDHTRVVFEMSRYAVQPGAHYEAVFTGLRTASGDLYNLGPYRIHFRTRGVPDLLPITTVALEPRTFCHDFDPEHTTCGARSTLRVEFAAADSIWHRWDHGDGTITSELLRRRSRGLDWLGFETRTQAASQRVSWSEPLPLCNLPAVRGSRITVAERWGSDGTRLENWEVVVAAPESPAHSIQVGALAVQLAFTDATVLDITYRLMPPGGSTAQVSERWWLYPGIGLVRRQIEIRRGAETRLELRRFAPGLPD